MTLDELVPRCPYCPRDGHGEVKAVRKYRAPAPSLGEYAVWVCPSCRVEISPPYYVPECACGRRGVKWPADRCLPCLLLKKAREKSPMRRLWNFFARRGVPAD